MFLLQLTADAETSVKIAWTLGLILALIVTAIDVHLLLRVIRAARKIDKLAGRTLPAAVGIVNNTAALKNLTATNEVAAALIANATPIVAVADSINKKLAAVSAFVGGQKR